MRTAVFIVGTRAQLIKVAPIVVECESHHLPVMLLMTGQHHETMQDILDEFGVVSPILSAVPATEHATVSSLLRWLPSAYRGVKRQLRNLQLDSVQLDVLVHGDTLSTLIGAFAGRRCGARVIHVESGLTSGRLFDPFPEEAVRRLVFRLADVALCPDEAAVRRMRNYHEMDVIDTMGNTILDAIRLAGVNGAQTSQPVVPNLVVSLHRFQNIFFRARLSYLVTLLERLAKTHAIHFILHPATRKRLKKTKLWRQLEENPRIHLRPRMAYGEFLRLAAGATCVLTDGGSNQEELAAIGVPTIIMRARSERPDGLGKNIILEADAKPDVATFLESGGPMKLYNDKEVTPGNSPSARIVQMLWP